MGREIGLCPQIAAPAAHVHILSGVDRSELRLRAKRPCERSGLAGQPGETAPVDRLIVDDLKDRVVKALHVQEAAELKRGDRKSAVKGKSVSVRVEPGGLSNFTKKTTNRH